MKTHVENLVEEYEEWSTPELGMRFVSAWAHRELYPNGSPKMIEAICTALANRDDPVRKQAIYQKMRRDYFEVKNEDPELAIKIVDMINYFRNEVL